VILELFGHRRLGGYLTIAEFGSGQLLRIDVREHCAKEYDAVDGRRLCLEHQAEAPHDRVIATQFYGPGAVYCMTPCDEASARAVASRNKPEPVTQWEMPAARLEAPRGQRRFEESDDGLDEDGE